MLRHLAVCLTVLILTTPLAQAQRVTLERATLVLGLGPELGPPATPLSKPAGCVGSATGAHVT